MAEPMSSADLRAIRERLNAALVTPCPACNGSGSQVRASFPFETSDHEQESCDTCGGAAVVPNAAARQDQERLLDEVERLQEKNADTVQMYVYHRFARSATPAALAVQPGPTAPDDDVTALEQWANRTTALICDWPDSASGEEFAAFIALLRRVARRLQMTASNEVPR